MALSTVKQPFFDTKRDGFALEKNSDNIDTVNFMKAELRAINNRTMFEVQTRHVKGKLRFDPEKDKAKFQRYEEACERVEDFYREQHEKQTVAYNLKARNEFRSKVRAEMTIWEAMEMLNTLIDKSDPNTSLTHLEHLFQVAEAMRHDGHPRWMQLTGLIHELGKLLFFFNARGKWDVVGDTFPVGCAFDERIIHFDTFKGNPDHDHEIYGTKYGIYSPGCGMDKIMLSWGHDEYLYHVVKDQSTLPEESLAMIRYHSFYPWHTAGAYMEFMDEKDKSMLKAVRAFNTYDLYSKSERVPNVEDVKVKIVILPHHEHR